MSDTDHTIRATDEGARTLARRLMAEAQSAALGVVAGEGGAPFVSRIAFGLDSAGHPVTLISDLAEHTRALRADPRAALLVGEPGARGDPLIHPRLSLSGRAEFTGADERPALRNAWLAHHPKSALYIDFADFSFVRFAITVGLLNAGFGKAYKLFANDIII